MILICGGAKAYGAFGITKLADAVIQTAKSAVLRFSQNNAWYLLFLLFSPELLAITNFMEVWWPMDGRSTANLRTKLRIDCLRFLCRQGEKISKAKSAVLNPQFLILQSVAILRTGSRSLPFICRCLSLSPVIFLNRRLRKRLARGFGKRRDPCFCLFIFGTWFMGF